MLVQNPGKVDFVITDGWKTKKKYPKGLDTTTIEQLSYYWIREP
jgi:hypothetical protein